MDSVAPKRWLNERPGRWIAEQEWPSASARLDSLPRRREDGCFSGLSRVGQVKPGASELGGIQGGWWSSVSEPPADTPIADLEEE